MSVTQTGGRPISWPLTATLLRGYGCDGGNGYKSVGIDSAGNKVYVPTSTGVSLFGIFKQVQWGFLQINKGTGVLSLPLSCTLLEIFFQHYGTTPQYNGFDTNSMTIYSSLKSEESLMWIAIGA